MDIKEILKEEFVGEKFRDNNNMVWGVVRKGYSGTKQSLILISGLDNDKYMGYQIEKLVNLSDIVNLKFEKM